MGNISEKCYILILSIFLYATLFEVFKIIKTQWDTKGIENIIALRVNDDQ